MKDYINKVLSFPRKMHAYIILKNHNQYKVTNFKKMFKLPNNTQHNFFYNKSN